MTIKQVKARLKAFTVEHGIEPFWIIGFRGQDEFELLHTRGGMDLRALNDAFKESYKTNFEDLEEYWAQWDDDNEGEEWKQ